VIKAVVEDAASSIFTAEVKMETAGSSRTLSGITTFQAAQCYNPEVCNLNIQNCRHLISHISTLVHFSHTSLAVTFIYSIHESAAKNNITPYKK
jgi:hypothetical protein